MKELADILKAIESGRSSDFTAALATVVRVHGSAYRRPGARMLILSDGRTVGGVSGGCLERDVIQRALAIMHGDRPALVRYDTTLDPESGSGYSLGCGGAIDILIESLTASRGRQLIQWLKHSRTASVAIATVISQRHPALALGTRIGIDSNSDVMGTIGGQAFTSTIAEEARMILVTGKSALRQYPTSVGPVELFVEVIEPPLDLMIFGAGSDAAPLVDFAKALGWKVTVVDVRSAPMDPGRVWAVDRIIRCAVEQVSEQVTISGTTAAVVMTHNFTHDSRLIQWLSTKPLQYLGLLGPRHRTEQVLAGLDAGAIHSPVGLDIGADNPQEVALSIVAEITAVLRGRTGRPLCSTEGPIHVDSPSTQPALSIDYEGMSCPTAVS